VNVCAGRKGRNNGAAARTVNLIRTIYRHARATGRATGREL
jgi:hypothetical protein